MNISIRTATTVATSNQHLFEATFTSEQKEDIVLLIETDGSEDGAERFHSECQNVIEQSLILTNGEASARLDSCLKELNGLIKGLLLSKTITDIQAIIGIIDRKNTLHISHAGSAEAYVIRGGSANQITEYAKGKSTPAFIHIASGQLENRDVILCSTGRLLRTLTPAQLVAMTGNPQTSLSEIIQALEVEKEAASIAIIELQGTTEPVATPIDTPPMPVAARRQASTSLVDDGIMRLKALGASLLAKAPRNASGLKGSLHNMFRNSGGSSNFKLEGKKLHLLLLAGVITIFLIIWLSVNLSSFAQRSQTKTELATIIESVEDDLRNAENRQLTGDKTAAIAILDRAEDQIKIILNDESRLYISEASELLQSIQSKREEVSNIVRRSPIVAANLADKKSAIQAIGLIGKGNEEFVAFDRQDMYQVISNTIEDPKRITDEEIVIDGVNFPRYQTQIFTTTSNGLIEFLDGKPVSMKTDDANGWIAGNDIEAYQRFIYLLAPDKNQIYKYERLSNRYSVPSEYNVNAPLSDALDMSIDVYIYVLKDDGTILKLLRGEVERFTINQAPDNVFINATKLYKVPGGKIYVLDPTAKKVIVLEIDADSGNATYLKQFVFESEQLTNLKDLYVDNDESWLYVLDEKRIVKIELSAQR